MSGFRFVLDRGGVVVRECVAADVREARAILKAGPHDHVTSRLSYEVGWPSQVQRRVHLCAYCVKPLPDAAPDTMHPHCRARQQRSSERRRDYWRDTKRRAAQGQAVKAARQRRLARGEGT